MQSGGAIVGVSDHGGWAIFVTVSADGKLFDRRRVELVDADLPKIPHHVEAQGLPLDAAVALVERVRASAERQARLRLEELTALGTPITAIALRECPALPATVAERITNYKARNVADWVMYRQALADAAESLGWAVHWYDAKKLDDKQFAGVTGAPWSKDHRMAMAAAIAVRK